ncbi:hypothetical protein PanWU01x14_310070 [Parasponia andersonii]|uniref:Uncharacterized protein n=1 Tax=Parasponia andersonii TaxID=3476 RepID=A0A2P5AQB2_PARAD|nr:hypothetical protein PanWU01x14_310070 [Parasponia andersonii]
MGVEGGNKGRILVAKPKSAAIAFAPKPKLAMDDQGGVEKATRNANLHRVRTLFAFGPIGPRESARGGRESERRRGNEEVSDWSWVEPDFLDAAAELARGTPAPREELEGDGVVLVFGGFGLVQEWDFAGGGSGGGRI